MSDRAVDRLLNSIEAGTPPPAEVFADDAALDTTVPNWRFRREGAGAAREQLAEWFRHPGRFEALRRRPLPGGEVVEFTLTWQERGIPHACHQVHILEVEGNRIVADTVFCGGVWPASLLARMAEAERDRC